MGPRKYFLDWLRVLAFAGLIVFHVGCLYASWDYNIKSPRPVPAVEWALLALAPWRMALLFVISGVASRYLLAKLGAGGFALDRLRRLLPVILVGSLVVIPPQTYIMLLAKGLLHGGYFHFWIFSYLAADQTLVAPLHRTMPTYDHLWFIVYLLLYTLVFAAVAAAVHRLSRSAPRTSNAPPAAPPGPPLAPVPPVPSVPSLPRAPLWALLTAPALWLIAVNFLIERLLPVTFYVVNDFGSHLKWGGMFVTGIAYATHEEVWEWARRHRARLLAAAACFLILQCICRDFWLAQHTDSAASALCWSLTSSLYAWTMIGALCGYGLQHLNNGSRVLSHFNEAILPIYVLHQPILFIGAFYVFPLELPLPLEALLLTFITGFGSLAIYEIAIRPFSAVRTLFGLKVKRLSITAATP
jgi:glucan biosynthesis protein C